MGGLNISLGGDEDEDKASPCDMGNKENKRFGVNASVTSNTANLIDTRVNVNIPPLPIPFPMN